MGKKGQDSSATFKPSAEETRHFLKLLDSGIYSDFKLVCHGKEFLVHKAIVCPQSPVMAAAADGQFQEATSATFNVDSFDVGTVTRMIQFLYTGNYDEGIADSANNINDRSCSKQVVNDPSISKSTLLNSENVQSGDTPSQSNKARLLLHVRINAIGDYFDIACLKDMANKRIADIFNKSWSADGFTAAVREAFNASGDPVLHGLMGENMARHVDDLLQHAHFLGLPVMDDLVRGILKGASEKQASLASEKRRQLSANTRKTNRQIDEHKREATRYQDQSAHLLTRMDNAIDRLRNANLQVCTSSPTGYCFWILQRYGTEFDPKFYVCCKHCYKFDLMKSRSIVRSRPRKA